MAEPTTLTSKGQVTVPREIRERLGLKAGDKLAFHLLSDGTVVMRQRGRTIADLGGILHQPGQATVPVEKMRVELGAEPAVSPAPRRRAAA